MALTDYLSAIADAIRKKDGTIEPIVATDFPNRILKIPSGGISEASLSYGNFTPSQNTKTISVKHGLNVIPNFTVVYLIDDVSSLSVSGLIAVSAEITISNGYKHYEVRNEWANIKSTASNEQLFVYSDTNVVFNLNDAPFWSGKNYTWICGRMEND